MASVKRYLELAAATFWLFPAALIIGGITLALAMLYLDRYELISEGLLNNGLLYSGGATGARTLLGAIASSAIGVAGTVFSITIAALSLAAGQMGPRLLRNFTKDRGNQYTLGVFLATFSYALIVLRSVRTASEGEFIPHLALTIAIMLAFVCVGTLVYFVDHMASRINVDTVIELVSADLQSAIHQLSLQDALPQPPRFAWEHAQQVNGLRHGYIQNIDTAGLVEWAQQNDCTVKLLVRQGDFLFPGAAVALLMPKIEKAEQAISDSIAVGQQRVSSEDIEYPVRQLVEVATRALSPGINDPETANSVLNRLGAALCELASRHLHTGLYSRDDIPRCIMPAITYDGLLDSMFHSIRQSASNQPIVLIRLLEILHTVKSVEHDTAREVSIQRYAELVLLDAERNIGNAFDLADIRSRGVQLQANGHRYI